MDSPHMRKTDEESGQSHRAPLFQNNRREEERGCELLKYGCIQHSLVRRGRQWGRREGREPAGTLHRFRE